MKKTLVITALTFALVAIAPAAFAGSATSTLTVNASVAANCTIQNATLKFGAYDPVVANAASPLDNSTTITVACTKGFIPTIGMSGQGARSMSDGTDSLTFELYKDVAGGTLWGDGTTGTVFTPPSAPGKGGAAYTIFGRIFGGQDVGVGAYSGSVTATVNF